MNQTDDGLEKMKKRLLDGLEATYDEIDKQNKMMAELEIGDSPTDAPTEYTRAFRIKKQIEEMGLAPDFALIVKQLDFYPADISDEFLLETIIHKILEGEQDQDDDESGAQSDNAIRERNQRLSMIESLIDEQEDFWEPSYEALEKVTRKPSQVQGRVSDQYKSQVCSKCYSYFKGIPKENEYFNCRHVYCENCIRQKFNAAVLTGENPEDFQCWYYKCKAKAKIDNMVRIFPSLESKDLGDHKCGPCSICFEDILGTEEQLKVFGCDHIYCYECILGFVKEKMMNMEVLKLNCPTCSAEPTQSKLEDLLPKHVYKKYQNFRSNALIERDPNLKWCSRLGCGKVVENSGKGSKGTCECGQQTCMKCGNEFHQGLTCQAAMEKEYKVLAKDLDFSVCPKCQSKVEKVSGCNHMTCPICTYEWCWLCGGTYSPGHFEALNPLGCPGLMGGSNSRKKWSKSKIYLYRIGMFLLGIVALALLPLWLVLGAIFLPQTLYEGYDHSRWTVVRNRILIFIASVALSPVTISCALILAVVPGSCLLIIEVIKECKRKAERRRRVQSRINAALAKNNIENKNSKKKKKKEKLQPENIYLDIGEPAEYIRIEDY